MAWPFEHFYAYPLGSNEQTHLRKIYHIFVGGTLTLIQKGKLEVKNKNRLKEHNWDRNFIFSKNSSGSHRDLEIFFRVALHEDESKQLARSCAKYAICQT